LSSSSHSLSGSENPRPVVRIHLHASLDGSTPEPGPLKLSALLRPRTSIPLTEQNLLAALARQPFVLLLSALRILYHAWILHYRKRLAVYVRPEPHPAIGAWGPSETPPDWSEGQGGAGAGAGAGGVGWQPEGLLETYARKRTTAFLVQRARETKTRITLISGHPSVPPLTFAPVADDHGQSDDTCQELTIWYLSPRLFTLLFLAPSSAHALLAGYTAERLFVPSSVALFSSIFTPSASSAGEQSSHRPPHITLAQRLRTRVLPPTLITAPGYAIPPCHPLDAHSATLRDAALVGGLLALDRAQEWAYRCVRARFVRGQEPWQVWERAAAKLESEASVQERAS